MMTHDEVGAQGVGVVAAPTPGPLRSRRLDLGMMMRTAAPPIDMVLRGLPLGSCGVILGSGGVGKSMLVLHVAAAVATGVDDLGCLLDDAPRSTGRVVYLAGEDDELVIHHRLRAFAEHTDDDRQHDRITAMDERVDIVSLVGTAPTLVGGGGQADDDAMAQIRQAAKGSRLLVIDPLRQFHAADENDNGAMTTLSKALAKIAHEERCAIIVVHHVSKAGAKDEDADAAMSRGASAITDNARWVMALRKLSESAHAESGLDGEAWEYLRQSLVKANYAALGGATVLRRCDGGVLARVMVRERDDVEEVLANIAPRRGETVINEDGDSLDPATGEPFPREPDALPATAADLFAQMGHAR